MKVWVVFYNTMDSYEVHAILDSREKAVDWVAKVVEEDDGDKNDYRIEQWNVD